MAAERPEKRTMRELWVAKTKTVEQEFPGSVPLYLTLSGADGRDIESHIAEGIIKRNEVGGIHEDYLAKIVAIESSPEAVLALQKTFPGLKILEQSIQELVRSASAVAWPTGTDVEHCRARIINLDLNHPLSSEIESGHLAFPLLTFVAKFSQLHATAPRLDWFLYLTLHGEITWAPEVCNAIQAYLAENCAAEPAFATACRTLLGDALFTQVTQHQSATLPSLSSVDQQKILMALVPKKISQLVIPQGWRVATTANLRYGGAGGRAPMVTWILEFRSDPRATVTPQAVYRDSLKGVLTRSGHIAENGSIS
jgi:hypothetical protein